MKNHHPVCIALLACLASMSCGPSYQKPGADFSLADPPAGMPTITAIYAGSGGALYQAPFDGSRVLANLGAYERLTILKTVLKTKAPDGVDWFLVKTVKGATGYVSEKEADDFGRAKQVDLSPHCVLLAESLIPSGSKDGKTIEKGSVVEAKFGLGSLTWLDDDGIVPNDELILLDQFEVGKGCEGVLIGAGQGNAYKNCFDESSLVRLRAGESATYLGSPEYGPPEGRKGDIVVGHPVFLRLEDGGIVCMEASDPLFGAFRHDKKTVGIRLGETPDEFHFEAWKIDMSTRLAEFASKQGRAQEFFEGRVSDDDSSWLVDVVDRSFGSGPAGDDDSGYFSGSVTVEEVWNYLDGREYPGYRRTLNLSVSSDRADIELNQDSAFGESREMLDKVAGHCEYRTDGSADLREEKFSYAMAIWKGEYWELKDGSWDSGQGGHSIEDVSEEISGALSSISEGLSDVAFGEGLFSVSK